MKKVVKRIWNIIVILMFIFTNIAILNLNRTEATAEQGRFEKSEFPYNITFTSIDSGANHTVAVDSEGNTWVWGTNDVAQLGFVFSTDSVTILDKTLTPVKNGYITKNSKISVGESHTIAIDPDGQMTAWGANGWGQIGPKSIEYTYSPIIIKSGTSFSKSAASTTHSVAIDTSGNLWTWGFNSAGQLGDGTTTDREVPVQIAEGTKFKEIATGLFSNLAIDTSGNLWGWGANAYGQLGTGTTEAAKEPIKVITGTKFSKIAMGSTYGMAIDTSGNLWYFGGSDITPKKIKEGTKFKEISLKNNHYMALDVDNNLWIAGFNTSGQLGNGTTDTSISIDAPKIIKEGTKFNTICAGYYTSFAIDENGNLWGWGQSLSGQVGAGTTYTYTLPIQITAKTYNVTLNTNGGTINSGNFTSYTQGTEKNLPTNITKQGYTFGGWYSNSSFTGTEVTKISKTDTGDKTYYAKWIASTDTNYTVQHYKQNTTLTGYVLSDTENLKGTTNSIATAAAKSYEGFIENTTYSGRIKTGTVAADGSLVLKLYYDRDTYSVTLNANGGTINSGNITNYTYGISAKTLPTNVTKEGYIFDGWYDNINFSGSKVTSITKTDFGDKIYYAKWLTRDNTTYVVQHYKQNIFLNGYTLEERESLEGTTDETVTATAKTYEGFTENTEHEGRVVSGIVAGDGSLVLKLYYDRNIYSVTLNTNEGTINSGNVTQYTYGITKTLPTDVTKEGYTFEGWYDNEEFTGEAITTIGANETGDKTFYAKWVRNEYTVTFKDGETVVKTETVTSGESATAPEVTKAGYTLSWDKEFSDVTEDITVNAVWTANTNTVYKVEHYKQNIDLNGYELIETEDLIETTDETVTATAKTYEGFTENTEYEERIPSGVIAGDGSLVLKLYYDRNTYNVTLNTNEGTINLGNITEYTYGIEKELPTDVTREGYTFEGWYNNEELTGELITTIGANEIGDKTFYAKWVRNEYTVTFKDGETVVKTETVTSGESATAPELTKAGYTLSWDKEFSNITEDITVNAVWTANTNTAYKVEHYVRNLDTEVEGYELRETENLTGTTDTIATAVYKEYEGITKNENYSEKIESGVIAGDGSLVLKLYYNRNSYNITYELNGGTANTTLVNKYVYGKEMILSNRISKEGFIFAGWYDNEELTGKEVTTIGANEIGDKTFYAKWLEEDTEEYYIISSIYAIDTSKNIITKVRLETTVEEFINNLTTNGTTKVVDQSGKEVSQKALVGTGYKLQISHNGTNCEYEIAVRGDLDGNGKITVTDLSAMNQALTGKTPLTGIYKIAADIDYNGSLTVTDLSMINQALVGKINL